MKNRCFLKIGGIEVGFGEKGKAIVSEIKYAIKYGYELSNRWLDKAPLECLEKLREAKHLEFLNPKTKQSDKEQLENIIKVLDNAIRKRINKDGVPKPPSYVREHGGLWKKD